MKRKAEVRAVWILLGLSALGACCLSLLGIPHVNAVLFLAIGWIPFVVRTAPQVTIDWPSVVIAALALVLFVALLHAFLDSFRRRNPEPVLFIDKSGAAIEPAAPPVRFSRTLLIAGFVLAMFTAGICAIGAVHQSIWLFSSQAPFLTRYKEASRRNRSVHQLHQIAIGLQNYQDVSARLPPGGTRDERGRMLHGWQTLILPFMEQRPLFDQIDLQEPWNSARNRKWMQHQIPGLIAYHESGPPLPTHDGDGFAVSHYSGNALVLGGEALRRASDFPDGAANTLLSGEATTAPEAWGSPTNWRDPRLGINRSAETFGGPWKRTPGATFVMADGSTRFIDETIDPRVLAALATPDGGE